MSAQPVAVPAGSGHKAQGIPTALFTLGWHTRRRMGSGRTIRGAVWGILRAKAAMALQYEQPRQYRQVTSARQRHVC